MAKTDVLARVGADLAQGHTQPAIQRLSSLVATHPTDLGLRRRLAAVHRMVGNRVEAGRWAYLDPTADPGETEAFERAYPSAAARLGALRWPRPSTLAPTEYARRRLEQVAVAASRERGAAATARTESARTGHRALVRAATVAAVLAVLGAVALAALGAVTVVQWLT
jgi:hypothetical protein